MKKSQERAVKAEANVTKAGKTATWKSPRFFIPAGIAALLGVYALSGVSKATRPVLHESGMRLDRLGEIPITDKGRIQPLDSFARNTARQFSKREFIYDKDLNKQPAIRWLADTMFNAEGHDEYRLSALKILKSLIRSACRKKLVRMNRKESDFATH